MGNSLAKERMLEKAEQVRGGFFLTYNLTIIGLKGPIREDEHKATARHPFGKAPSVGDVLNSPHRGTLACSIRCSTGSLTSWGRGLVERLTLITGSRSQRFWQG